MKFKPNMYIRTKDGYIAKIDKVGDTEEYGDSKEPVTRLEVDIFYQKAGYNGSFYVYSDWIAKASHNIIDLIKPKDIILGKDGKIYQCQKIYKDYVFTYSKNEQGLTITLVDYQIDKILTREVFEREAYKV